MTDTNQLPEPELGYIQTDKSNQPAFSARQMREAMKHAPQPAQATQAVPMTDEEAKELIKKSDLLDMFLHIGWYSAPRKNFDTHALALIRAVEACERIARAQAQGQLLPPEPVAAPEQQTMEL